LTSHSLETEPVYIHRFRESEIVAHTDLLAVEEPLEIRLGFGPKNARQAKSLAITMRTPGKDPELALGFLFTEGILHDPKSARSIFHCGPKPIGNVSKNIIRIELTENVELDWKRLQRHSYTTSSCGICGKTSIEAVRVQSAYSIAAGPTITSAFIRKLPEKMLDLQSNFLKTGGLHASALFDRAGDCLILMEDVGRHNALDKVIGSALMKWDFPLKEKILVLSGRISFELVQKAAMAGIPVIAAVGAPSSLSVRLAKELGITLLGFVRRDRFNIYSSQERIYPITPSKV